MSVHLLGAESIALDYPTKHVFADVTIGVEQGDRIGIVGRNGDGKSSLLRILTGLLEPDAGRVTHRSGVRVGVLSQDDELTTNATVAESIVGQRAEHEWAADPKIRDVIEGLASDIPWDAKISELSGGQRRRTALARLLVGDWDLIALDEPTNHLDMEGVAWLAQHLNQRWGARDGALLVITHDRWFLDAVCTAMWEVHDGVVDQYEGGYAAYVLQRVERDRIAAATEQKRQNLMRKELAWLRRGAPARTAKSKFRVAAATQLIEDVPPIRNPIELERLATARLGKDVVDLLDVSVSFGENEVLRDVTWRIAPGERTGILGANGAGKSTLLNLISGQLQPTSGRVKRGKTAQIGVLDQQFSQLAEISGDRVREVLGRTKATFTIEGKDFTPAQLLERLGFDRAHLSARVNDLSGGQKRRLQILLLLLSEPNVIILDEPTNDVDSDMLTALEDLLDSWPGTLIVVSHDRYLVERVTDGQYAVIDGKLRHLPGGIDEYLRLAAAQRSEGEAHDVGRADERQGAEGADSELSGAERHALQKEVASVERRLDRRGAEVEKLHEKLAAHDQSDYEGLSEITVEVRELETEIAELEGRWLELSTRLE